MLSKISFEYSLVPLPLSPLNLTLHIPTHSNMTQSIGQPQPPQTWPDELKLIFLKHLHPLALFSIRQTNRDFFYIVNRESSLAEKLVDLPGIFLSTHDFRSWLFGEPPVDDRLICKQCQKVEFGMHSKIKTCVDCCRKNRDWYRTELMKLAAQHIAKSMCLPFS